MKLEPKIKPEDIMYPVPDFCEFWGDFRRNVSRRSVHNGLPTAIDPDMFLPYSLKTDKWDVFQDRSFSIEKAEKTVAFLSLLKHYSNYVSGEDTESSNYRRFYIANILILHYIVNNLLYDNLNGKIQLEENGTVIRINLARKKRHGQYTAFDWEKIFIDNGLVDRHIERDRVTGAKIITNNVLHDDYWRQIASKLRDAGISNSDIRGRLYNVWLGISIGLPPGSEYQQKVLTVKEAACYIRKEPEELCNLINRHLIKCPYYWKYNEYSKYDQKQYSYIDQCKNASNSNRGRLFSFVFEKTLIVIPSCFKCSASEYPGQVVDPRENKKCEKLPFYNRDLLTWNRNEFSESCKKKILERDKLHPCLICKVRNETVDPQMILKPEVGHVHSAYYSRKNLTPQDGFSICRKHNQEMGDISLIVFAPECIEEAKRMRLNI